MTAPLSPRTGAVISSVNFDSPDPHRLAAFWAAATGGAVGGGHGDFVWVQPLEPGGLALYFQRVEHPSAPGRLHLDLKAPNEDRIAEVARLRALGATQQWEVEVVGEVPWVDWTTMADPDGNLFCVAATSPAALAAARREGR